MITYVRTEVCVSTTARAEGSAEAIHDADNSIRWALFAAWTRNPFECDISCYLVIVLNPPIRDLLMHLFVHSEGHDINDEALRKNICLTRISSQRHARTSATEILAALSGAPGASLVMRCGGLL